MMYWGNGYGFMGGGWLFMGLFWLVVIIGIVALVRAAGGSRREPRKTALDILQERYARGEISREEYQQKRADLEK
jgi:putative membrane protein